ncbi:E3 ubiquitin-protein ligase MARCH3-like [Chelonus insularis]|uniref:E3 ubiquitin-protein ligase MARCH3-like n=1 Tax=Chelonus insularis TaxID=460826 RepID=UPI00158A70E7|nr:E3 ubiquitin-protein ligase MARCH3-like [Chelonus insularis]
MLCEQNSAASTLNWLINKVIESEKIKIDEIKNCNSTSFSDASTQESGCRICYDNTIRYPIIYPCKCKGTMGAIHLSCLERWLEESNRSSCELCGYQFDIERTPRYSALRSIFIWICLKHPEHQLFLRNLRVDIVRCLIVTPLTMGSSYVCIVAADFYSANNYDNFPPARWTTYSLLAMMVLLIFSYFIWMFMAIQYHQKVWFYWWQKTSIVKLKHHHTLTVDADKSPMMCRRRMDHEISPV